MTVDELRAHLAFETSLAPGLPVTVRWTNSSHYWSGTGSIVRVNRATVRVKLAHDVGGPGSYPVGREIVVPLLSHLVFPNRWSVNNGVFPPVSSTVSCPQAVSHD